MEEMYTCIIPACCLLVIHNTTSRVLSEPTIQFCASREVGTICSSHCVLSSMRQSGEPYSSCPWLINQRLVTQYWSLRHGRMLYAGAFRQGYLNPKKEREGGTFMPLNMWCLKVTPGPSVASIWTQEGHREVVQEHLQPTLPVSFSL